MYYNIEAIILKRESWREDDLLVTAYSRERGKLKLQARGAKKIKSKLAGHLEPVSLSLLNVTRGKNIDQLIGAQMIEPYGNIKIDLVKLGYAGWMMEIVDRLVGEEARDEKIFILLKKGLEYLNQETKKPRNQETKKSRNQETKKPRNQEIKLARISFGFKLLELLGLNPVEKKGQELSQEIKFVIDNNLENIFGKGEIRKNLKKLNEVLDKELRWNLDSELGSEAFLKKIIIDVL